MKEKNIEVEVRSFIGIRQHGEILFKLRETANFIKKLLKKQSIFPVKKT